MQVTSLQWIARIRQCPVQSRDTDSDPMAQTHSYPALATLRAITYRLISTQPDQLPQLASQISGSIWNCKDLLSASSDTLGSKSDAATLVHRFKSRIGVLLQDRTVEGRWAGLVLCKAAIEAGGVETLSKSNAWVRNLLAILKKNDPPTTRYLAIVTLTRIFMLTWEHTNLIREFTTPALLTFVSACLGNSQKPRCSARELQAVLEAFATLLPRHPTIFRTHEAQIKSLITQVLASESADTTWSLRATAEHRETAQRLLVLLHHCAPKQGDSEAWDRSFQAAITAAHSTCDRLYRSLIEDWRSTAGVEKVADASILSSSEAEQVGEDTLGFPGWHGVLAGQDRLITLMEVLRSHMTSATNSAVPVRLGRLVDLLTRVLSLTVPSSADSIKSNPQISKDEREALFGALPNIHIAAIDLTLRVLDRFGQASAPFVNSLLELLIDVFRAERFDDDIRVACYRYLSRILQLFGRSLPKEIVLELAPMMKTCCNDLISTNDSQVPKTDSSNGSIESTTISTTKTPSSRNPIIQPSNNLNLSASTLLPAIITNINPISLPRKLRTQIERTAILTRNKEALLACVMNPLRTEAGGKLQTSLLPLLAGDFPDSLEVEALVRPRMPPVVLNGVREEDVEEEEEDDDDGMGADEMPDVGSANGMEGDAVGSHTRNGHESTDDLYTTTPPPPASEQITSTASTSTTKRPADVALNGPAKRTRAATNNQVPASDTPITSTVPEATPFSADTAPATVAVDGPRAKSESTAVLPRMVAANGSADVALTGDKETGPGSRGIRMVDSDDDGSDFEMPPLTMEPSDDEVGEEEDDDDDE